MKEAIKKAIEGGYERKNGSFSLPMKLNDEFDVWEYDTNAILLEPLFWQCLGKSLGWNEVEIYMSDYENDHPFMGGTIDYPYGEGAGMTYKVEGWKYHWLQFINHLAEGKDAEEFFKNFN